MEFKGLTSASHMSLPEAENGSEEGQLGSEISGAVSRVTTPGASRLQASQLQERSTTMQRLHGSRGNHDSASGISTDTLRLSDFSGAITRRESLRVPPEVTFVASPQRTEYQPSECPYCGHNHWPGVHTCADCCMNAPPNLKPGRDLPPRVNLVPPLRLCLILKTAAAKESSLVLELVVITGKTTSSRSGMRNSCSTRIGCWQRRAIVAA